MIRAFRPSLWALFIGLTFSIAAFAIITIPTLISLFTHKPMMIKESRAAVATHTASTGDLFGMLALSMVFILIGVSQPTQNTACHKKP